MAKCSASAGLLRLDCLFRLLVFFESIGRDWQKEAVDGPVDDDPGAAAGQRRRADDRGRGRQHEGEADADGDGQEEGRDRGYLGVDPRDHVVFREIHRDGDAGGDGHPHHRHRPDGLAPR
ncbi:hypothetical protein ACFQER_09925 [Halomicroarcula sp. GCM10025894]|uniref:hypothetical protein n=1 Tax=Halomicroarcula sp. GCM10025894 TaxID=3252673 RepID=UPI00362202ED